jgi:hypothetical protein
VTFLQKIKNQLQSPILQKWSLDFQNKIEKEICYDLLNAFGKRQQHIVDLAYDKSFNENQIPTKLRPIHMNA